MSELRTAIGSAAWAGLRDTLPVPADLGRRNCWTWRGGRRRTQRDFHNPGAPVPASVDFLKSARRGASARRYFDSPLPVNSRTKATAGLRGRRASQTDLRYHGAFL